MAGNLAGPGAFIGVELEFSFLFIVAADITTVFGVWREATGAFGKAVDAPLKVAYETALGYMQANLSTKRICYLSWTWMAIFVCCIWNLFY